MERKENKKPQPPLNRKRGKLSKKEEVEMKKRHRDISWLLAPPPPQDIIIHEKVMAREMEEMK